MLNILKWRPQGGVISVTYLEAGYPAPARLEFTTAHYAYLHNYFRTDPRY